MKELSNIKNFWILAWLYSGLFLMLLMITIGGITRLTGSGLSIVQWKLISGIIPPLSSQDWQETFHSYKQFPEYLKVKNGMTLSEFKTIFWWEYIHRFIGRLTGVIFIIPFCIFLFLKKLYPALIKKLILLFFLGALQGLLGWFMVKSGLIKNPNVSHLRLAAHLGLAFMLGGYIFWIILGLKQNSFLKIPGHPSTKFSFLLLFLIYSQLILGALVAGLKAGYSYNTFPLMNGALLPIDSLGNQNLLYSGPFIQFLHRWFGFLVFMVGIKFYARIKTIENFSSKGKILLIIFAGQIILGVSTLVFHVPIVVAVSHQITAFILFLFVIMITYNLKSYPMYHNYEKN